MLGFGVSGFGFQGLGSLGFKVYRVYGSEIRIKKSMQKKGRFQQSGSFVDKICLTMHWYTFVNFDGEAGFLAFS